MEADYELIDNEERHQYEFHVDQYTPKIEYIKSTNGEIYLTHTEVPTQLGGKGIGSQLVEKALKDMGLTMSSAITMFLVKVGREKRIPFEITADPFYSESNIRYLEKIAADIKNGKATFSEHALIDGED